MTRFLVGVACCAGVALGSPALGAVDFSRAEPFLHRAVAEHPEDQE